MSTTRPSYAEMAVRGKGRLTDNNGDWPSSEASPVPAGCSEAAGEMQCEKHGPQGRRSDKCRKSSPRHNLTQRRLSGDCIVKENHISVQNTICQADLNSAAS